MAHPKRRQSKSRRDKRRTHFKAIEPQLSKCNNCGATHRYHRICPECGFYRGRLVDDKKAV